MFITSVNVSRTVVHHTYYLSIVLLYKENWSTHQNGDNRTFSVLNKRAEWFDRSRDVCQ